MHMSPLRKILSLAFVQAVLISSSFLVTAYIELQYSTSGKLIDIAGKSRLLVSDVQLETYRAIFHDSETHAHVEVAIMELERNTALLRHGGIVDGIRVPPLPQDLQSELDEMLYVVDQYNAAVTEIIDSKELLTYDNVESAHVLSNMVVEMADDITAQISADVDAATDLNLSLLILLGIGNVLVLMFLTFLMWRIIRAHVDQVVRMKRFEALGRFSAAMAHNIRNPLGVLRNSIELIKTSNPDPPFDKEAARMERSIKRISHQIESILNFVNGSPLNIRSVMLLDTLHHAVDMLVLPKNIDLRLPHDDRNISVECDDKKIEFVFYNLLVNAVQAIGGDQGHIAVRIRDGDAGNGDKNGTAILEFENSGPSIPPHVLPRMFEPLFTTKKDGAGLGLAYCKNTVELHNGRITTSNQNGLVLFSIHIPKTHDAGSTDAGGGEHAEFR